MDFDGSRCPSQINDNYFDNSRYFQDPLNDPNLIGFSGPAPDLTLLAPCEFCNRTFIPASLTKHKRGCYKNWLKQKERENRAHDEKANTAYSVGGDKPILTIEQMLAKRRHRRLNWRLRHEEFLRAVHAARDYAEAMASGHPLPPPPPPVQEPDLKECPYCHRRFHEKAHERHLPRCKEQSIRNNKERPSYQAMEAKRRLAVRLYYQPSSRPNSCLSLTNPPTPTSFSRPSSRQTDFEYSRPLESPMAFHSTGRHSSLSAIDRRECKSKIPDSLFDTLSQSNLSHGRRTPRVNSQDVLSGSSLQRRNSNLFPRYDRKTFTPILPEGFYTGNNSGRNSTLSMGGRSSRNSVCSQQGTAYKHRSKHKTSDAQLLMNEKHINGSSASQIKRSTSCASQIRLNSSCSSTNYDITGHITPASIKQAPETSTFSSHRSRHSHRERIKAVEGSQSQSTHSNQRLNVTKLQSAESTSSLFGVNSSEVNLKPKRRSIHLKNHKELYNSEGSSGIFRSSNHKSSTNRLFSGTEKVGIKEVNKKSQRAECFESEQRTFSSRYSSEKEGHLRNRSKNSNSHVKNSKSEMNLINLQSEQTSHSESMRHLSKEKLSTKHDEVDERQDKVSISSSSSRVRNEMLINIKPQKHQRHQNYQNEPISNEAQPFVQCREQSEQQQRKRIQKQSQNSENAIQLEPNQHYQMYPQQKHQSQYKLSQNHMDYFKQTNKNIRYIGSDKDLCSTFGRQLNPKGEGPTPTGIVKQQTSTISCNLNKHPQHAQGDNFITSTVMKPAANNNQNNGVRVGSLYKYKTVRSAVSKIEHIMNTSGSKVKSTAPIQNTFSNSQQSKDSLGNCGQCGYKFPNDDANFCSSCGSKRNGLSARS